MRHTQWFLLETVSKHTEWIDNDNLISNVFHSRGNGHWNGDYENEMPSREAKYSAKIFYRAAILIIYKMSVKPVKTNKLIVFSLLTL